MKRYSFLVLYLFTISALSAQRAEMVETASIEQIYGTQEKSDELLPMNELNIDFGYVLYEAKIVIESENPVLEIENVRDYATVYIDGKLQGTMTDNKKKLTLPASPGEYTLQVYAENIGRITYGPEILDNSKGLFGEATLDGEPIQGWVITELKVKNYPLNELKFSEQKNIATPGFQKGYFEIENPVDSYLDISGWGMGEVWINGNYLGSYWEEEKQQSIQVPATALQNGKNEVIVFELKNNGRNSMQVTNQPVFK